MKKCLLFLLTSLSFYSAKAQVAVEKSGDLGDSFNRWTIEATVGQSKGIKPFDVGYYSSDPGNLFGGIQANSFGLAARYMLSPKFGFRLGFNYDKFTDQSGSGSLDFETKQYRTNIEAVVNGSRLFNVEEALGRFGFLFHGGVQLSTMHSDVYDLSELNGGLILGFSPQFRLSNNLSLTGDVSLLQNFRQHFNWNGTNSDPSNNLTGSMVTTSLGLSFSFGNSKMHGDWAVIQDKSVKDLEALKARIGDIETSMVDTDKDGVADYLDVEQNSIAGVAVDTKGRMVDKNKNGVADDLEKYVDNVVNNNSNKTAIKSNMTEELINEGYIAAYFDLNKKQPTNASADNIGFILNYLRANSSKSVEITGYADQVGNTDYNNKLSADRAQSVKDILIKSGIDASRVNIVGNGEDNSFDSSSSYARVLARKVLFKIK